MKYVVEWKSKVSDEEPRVGYSLFLDWSNDDVLRFEVEEFQPDHNRYIAACGDMMAFVVQEDDGWYIHHSFWTRGLKIMATVLP